MANFNLRLLTKDEVEYLQSKNPNLLIATPTDMALLLNCYTYNRKSIDSIESHPPCYYFTMTNDDIYYTSGARLFFEVTPLGNIRSEYADYPSNGIRPVLEFLDDSFLELGIKDTPDGKMTIYGEYPMWVVSDELADILNQNYYSDNLQKTGKRYTFIEWREVPVVETTAEEDDDYDDYELKPKTYVYDEYYYNEKKYVRITSYYLEQTRELSNGVIPSEYEDYWLEVVPIPWFVDLDKHKLISKYCLVSGVPISFKNYKDVYKNSFMKEYLEKYLTPEIIPSQVRVSILDDNPELKKVMIKDFCNNRKYW